jgi:hypothetical protein
MSWGWIIAALLLGFVVGASFGEASERRASQRRRYRGEE